MSILSDIPNSENHINMNESQINFNEQYNAAQNKTEPLDHQIDSTILSPSSYPDIKYRFYHIGRTKYITEKYPGNEVDGSTFAKNVTKTNYYIYDQDPIDRFSKNWPWKILENDPTFTIDNNETQQSISDHMRPTIFGKLYNGLFSPCIDLYVRFLVVNQHQDKLINSLFETMSSGNLDFQCIIRPWATQYYTLSGELKKYPKPLHQEEEDDQTDPTDQYDDDEVFEEYLENVSRLESDTTNIPTIQDLRDETTLLLNKLRNSVIALAKRVYSFGSYVCNITKSIPGYFRRFTNFLGITTCPSSQELSKPTQPAKGVLSRAYDFVTSPFRKTCCFRGC
jgi:hypothetical protein